MNQKADSENLMNAMLPLAEKMLRQYGEFYPFGGYMKPDGTIFEVGADDAGSDNPKSSDLLLSIAELISRTGTHQQIQGCRASC
jgi:hypothetical protein